VVAGAEAMTYIDGDQDDCRWLGTAHASKSTRSAYSRSGGIERNFAYYNVSVMSWTGASMPPVQNVFREYAQMDGANYIRTRLKSRVLVLNCQIEGSTLANYHLNKRNFMNAFIPNLVAIQRPCRLKYTGGGVENMVIDAYYDGGLEGGVIDGFTEKFPLKLVCPQPYYKLEGEAATVLPVQASVAACDYLAYRSASGVWSAVTTGTNNQINAMAIGPDQKLYIGGTFTSLDPAGAPVATHGIGCYDPVAGTWSNLGDPFGVGTVVNALVFGANGVLYAGGTLTGYTTNVASWNGAAWAGISAGVTNAIVRTLCFDRNGYLVIGGHFTQFAGVAHNRIVIWNGAALVAVGSGTNAEVYQIVLGLDNNLYIGGNFTTATDGGGAVTVNYITKWDGTNFKALGPGLSGSVGALAVAKNGNIVAGGGFATTSDATITLNKIGEWNGAVWSALDGGVSGTVLGVTSVLNVDVLSNGTYVVSGLFTTAGTQLLPEAIAYWTGSSWGTPDIDLPGAAPYMLATLSDQTGGMYAAIFATGAAVVAGTTTVSNYGNSDAYPVITITAPAAATTTLYHIANRTTGEGIYFRNLTLQAGESIRIDLRPGQKTITSSWKGRGSMTRYLLPTSDLSTMRLKTFQNTWSVFASHASTTASMWWDEYRIAIDGGAA
jgi:hypothetical protein